MTHPRPPKRTIIAGVLKGTERPHSIGILEVNQGTSSLALYNASGRPIGHVTVYTDLLCEMITALNPTRLIKSPYVILPEGWVDPQGVTWAEVL